MNPCHEMEPLLSALLDDELNASQQAMLSEHLATCPSCASQLVQFRELDSLLVENPLVPSATLLARVSAIPQRARRRSIGRLAWSCAAAAALLAAGTWIQIPRATAEPMANSLESLQWIHRVQQSAQRSTLRTCEWDLRLLKLQVDRMQLPSEQKTDLLVRLERLMQRVQVEQSLSPSFPSGA